MLNIPLLLLELTLWQGRQNGGLHTLRQRGIARLTIPAPNMAANNSMTECLAVHQQLHGDSGSMLTACSQTEEERILGRFCIQMERLRIKLAGKAHNLRLIQRIFCAAKLHPLCQLFNLKIVITLRFT